MGNARGFSSPECVQSLVLQFTGTFFTQNIFELLTPLLGFITHYKTPRCYMTGPAEWKASFVDRNSPRPCCSPEQPTLSVVSFTGIVFMKSAERCLRIHVQHPRFYIH